MKPKKQSKTLLDNSLSSNKYCFCRDYLGRDTKCLICESLKNGKEYRRVNKFASDKYLVVVTGTNGKTTITNILGLILGHLFPNKVSYSSSTGVYERGKKISNSEQRASEHYVYLLNQKESKIVICEQPEAGIYKFGLPIDHDIAIIPNITEDHLNRNWIRNGMWDVFSIKAQTVKMAIEGVVISLDYPWTRKLLSEFPRQHYFAFTTKKSLANRYKSLGPVVYLDKGRIIINDSGNLVDCGKVDSFLLTIDGVLEYNILNLLAIIAFLYNSKLTRSKFGQALDLLRKLAPSFRVNPARFTVMDYNGTLVILDYAHNLDGYIKSTNSIIKLKKKIKVNRTVGLITLLYGKTSQAVKKITECLADAFDEVAIKEREDEVTTSQLIKGISKKNILVDIWRGSYSDFLKVKSSKYDIIYMTLGAADPVSDFETLVSENDLEDISISNFK